MGHLAPYARDVRFCAWRWPVGEARGNKQSAITQAILTSFTFMPMPKLLAAPGSEDDWSHLFGGVAGEEGLRASYADFQRELRALADDFDAYNAAAPTRPFPDGWGLWTNHPALLEITTDQELDGRCRPIYALTAAKWVSSSLSRGASTILSRGPSTRPKDSLSTT